MLYLEDDSRCLWPEVSRALAELGPLEMVLCAYAGDPFESPIGPFAPHDGPGTFAPVTAIGDGTPLRQSERVEVDDALLDELERDVHDLEEWGDSFLVGRPGHSEWIAAAIPHEGMILVDDEFGSALAAAGYRLSEDPPDWWQGSPIDASS